MTGRLTLTLALLLAAIPALAQEGEPAKPAPSADSGADEAAATLAKADAASSALFAENCASCHAVPDLTLRTERAWLDQVNRTS